MNIPSPQDLGLPPKYKKWREHQEEAIRVIDESPRNVIGLMLPPGAGKSVIYMAWALWRGKRACFLTPSKFLQDQLNRDFSSLGLLDLRGQSSPEYVCEVTNGSVADGPCHGGYECPVKGRCEYYVKQKQGATEKLIVTNPMYWMHNRPLLGDFDALFVDEGHRAFDEIAQRMSISFSKRVVKDYLHRPPTREWKAWAGFHKSILGDQMRRLKNGPKGPAVYEEARILKRLHEKMTLLAEAEPNALIYQEHSHGWTWDCIWPGAYRGLLTGHAKKYIFTSGTMTKRTLQMLGYRREEYTWAEFPSTFPIERCPVHVLPAPRMNIGTPEHELRRWLEIMDLYMDTRTDRRGLIHSGSYDRMYWIAANSRHKGRMITHSSSASLAEARARHLKTKNGILVSPVLIEGADFAYDQARFQIIAKLFFANPKDPIVAERTRQDPQYPWYTAAIKVQQARGRVNRSEDDFGETAIADGAWQGWFFNAASHHFTAYFKDAVRVLNGVPKAKPLPIEARANKAPRVKKTSTKPLDVVVDLSASSAPALLFSGKKKITKK